MAEQKRTGSRKRVERLDWEDLRVFLALGRHGSLSAAARALGVNHATISRRIQALEDSLEERLVDRRPDGYVLTPAGRLALAAASDMEAAAQTLAREGDDDGAVRGLVRINASPALAQGFLIDRLARLTTAHPGLDIDLATDLRSVSLDRHQADIAVRLTRPRDGDFIAKPLGTMAFGFYGTPAVCDAVESGSPPVFITFDEQNSDMPDATWLARHFPRARVAFRADNHLSQAIAARTGVGIVLLPHYLGRQVPGLRVCALDAVREPREVWLLIRGGDRKDRPIRTVADHLQRVFEEERVLFEA
ncbi:LysR family transcriptional regulator [Mitsuaria sp. GD03876]|uniref:LysR family transcriptional regulator n=1 Tax=Mitsuaria sp. GD03876 TaxID=2975399 RepID=UPI00244CDAEE|nr:LysR family transcriptional regulator [Mitsuaria sp. GD03876]MDH0864435.1 LysR family transcriptional regulator [Mitsuaria sp. GD03876]